MKASIIYDILIVGAGPSGIAAALEAKRIGLENILILEKGRSHSNMIRTYYKEGKRVDASYAGIDAVCHGVLCLRDGNRESYLDFMDHVIQTNSLAIQYETEVWKIEKDTGKKVFSLNTSQGDLQAKTIIIAIGKMGRPQQPDYYKEIPGTLKKNKIVLFDINTRPIKNEMVLVVGGGDSAGEYVDMLHQDNIVYLSYRRDAITKMNPINQGIVEKLAEQKKATLLLGTDIADIQDQDGRAKVNFKNAVHDSLLVDTILYALGGVTPVTFLSNCNIETSERGEAIVSETLETSLRGLYIVGDLLGKGRGGGSIISGFNSAHAAVCDLAKKYFEQDNIPSQVALDHLAF